MYCLTLSLENLKNSNTNNKSTNKTKYTPPDDHYFKYGHSLIKKLTFEDSDRDILNMLEEIFLKRYA